VKQVVGYPDSASIFLAIERGEVHGRTVDLSTLRSVKPEWLKPDGGFRVLVQFARATRHPDFPDVPTARELAKNEAARALIELAELPYAMSRPFAAPPDLPADRAKALQRAFLAVHDDPQYLEDAAKLRVDVSPIGGDGVLRAIDGIGNAAPELLEYVRKLLAETRGGGARARAVGDNAGRACCSIWGARATFARLPSSCTLLDWLEKNGARAGPATDHAIERPEETHARHSRSSALARTESRRERRIRQVQARADALRPLHGGRGRAGLSRHRGSPRAGPAAGALEAARRSRLIYPALRHRRIVGPLPRRNPLRRRAQRGATPLRKGGARGRRPRHHRGLAGRAGKAARVRVAEGLAVLDPAQRLPPARECGERARAALVRDLGAERHERDRQHRFRLQLSLYVQR